MKENHFVLSLLIFILVIHILAIANFWYWSIDWLDIPMHFLGGLWVALFFFWILKKRFVQVSQVLEGNFLLLGILSLGFVSLIGIGWEFYEFLYDKYLAEESVLFQAGVADTIADLFFDLIGGLVAVLVYKIRRKRISSLRNKISSEL